MDSTADLANAGATDFSWVSKGVDNGIQYAQGQAQIDLQKQLAGQKAQELQQQIQANSLAKSQHLFDTMTKGLDQEGKTRDMYFALAKQQADMFDWGDKFDPTFWAYMNDPKNNEAALKAVTAYKNAMADGDFVLAQKSLAEGTGVISGDSMKKYEATLSMNKKEDEANQIQQQNADINQQNADTKRLEVQQKGGEVAKKTGNDLRKDSNKIETAFSKLENPIEEAQSALAQNTPAGDRAANIALTKISGVNRFNAEEARVLGSGLGNYTQQAKQALNMRTGNGGIYSDQNRQQINDLLSTLSSNIQTDKKQQLEPIYNTAKIQAPDQLAKGMILSTKTLKNTFNENPNGAPSLQNQPDPNAPAQTLKAKGIDQVQQQKIKVALGGFKRPDGKPIDPSIAESYVKNKFGVTPQEIQFIKGGQ